MQKSKINKPKTNEKRSRNGCQTCRNRKVKCDGMFTLLSLFTYQIIHTNCHNF